MSDWRFAIDSGGTFTDLIAVGPDQQQLTLKVPSVPDHPAMGPMNAIEAAMRQLGDVRVVDVAHGTTVGLNALLQRRFPRVALIVTRGFRNVLEIARHTVPGQWGSIYSWVKPPRVVPLEWVIEIDERIDANGAVLEALDPASLQRAVERIAGGDIETVAVCLLHAYRNPAHEQAVAAALRQRMPSLPLSLSSEVMPEFREYERMMTTATAAASCSSTHRVRAPRRDLRSTAAARGRRPSRAPPPWPARSCRHRPAPRPAAASPVHPRGTPSARWRRR
jgi:N-methylhydantoinase A